MVICVLGFVLVFDVWCYIIYIIHYTYYYILLLSYTILFHLLSSPFPSLLSSSVLLLLSLLFPILSPLFLSSSHPFLFCSSSLLSSSIPSSSSIHLLLPSPAPPNHSRNTCRYLHILIYILSISHSRLQIFDPACFIGVDG